MVMDIREFGHINHSPGFALAAKGWAENVHTGNGPQELTLSWDQRTIVAFEAEVPIGVVVWSKIDHLRDAWIVLSYVDPKFRRKGICSALYKRLVELAREEGLRSISGGIKPTNNAMVLCAEKQGRKPVGVTYSQII